MSKLMKSLMLAAVASAPLLASAAFAEDKVTLRMVWWGSEGRTTATLKAIEQFEALNPNIDVEAEALPFDGYMDKLSTQIAANDAPDVIQLPVEYVSQLASGGALLNLDAVDLTKLDPATTQAAHIEGQQVAVASGLSATAIVANKSLFEAANVPLPDDATWTWDDFAAIAKAITDGSPAGTVGTQALGTDLTSFEAYLRQNGSQVYDAQGNILIEPEDVVSYLELTKKIIDEGGSYGAETSSEVTALPLEQTPSATNTAAMGFWASAQFTALAKASGEDLALLRLPSMTGEAGAHQMSIGVAQYWSASSRSAHPAEAQALLDFIVNDIDAGKTLLIVRGTPPNSDVRDAITPDLTPTDAVAANFIGTLSPEAISTPLPPPGYGTFRDIFRRYTAEYLFGRLSAEDAANQMIGELKSNITQ
ncbi:MAG TPA: extracellular solute-binding protein [Devosia sp.]|nr:extracellular solute-binding protein [Devosia sp.]